MYHADWGSSPRKRWLAKAVLENGRYTAYAPELVGNHEKLLSTAKKAIGESGCAVIGFDFPIGIPISYARLVGATTFKSFLMALGKSERSNFYNVCEKPSEISRFRPFYPQRPGRNKTGTLVLGIGIQKHGATPPEMRTQTIRKERSLSHVLDARSESSRQGRNRGLRTGRGTMPGCAACGSGSGR